MKKILLFFIILLVSVFLYYDSRLRLPPVSESRLMMDTVITVKAYGDNASKAIDACFNIFKEIENEVSYHIATSSLYAFNHTKQTEKKGHLANIIELCKKYEKITNEYFDPTFSSLTEVYGFYGKIPKELPSDEIIKNILDNKIGLSKMLTSASSSYLLNPQANLDLGGAAGGYALGLAADAMKKCGCNSFLIDDSGDIIVYGNKPDGSPWKIAVKSPYSNSPIALAQLKSGETISTSGNYERFVEINNVKYGHIMNPHTGRPADEFSSVTVIADVPDLADIISTALFAMPFQIALNKANELKLAALFVTKDKKIILSEKGKSSFNVFADSL